MSDYIDNVKNDGGTSSEVIFSQIFEHHSPNLDQLHLKYNFKSTSPNSSSDEVDKIFSCVEVESKLLPELNHSESSTDNLTNNDKSESPVPIDSDFHNMSICEMAGDLGGQDQVNSDIAMTNKLSSRSECSESFLVVVEREGISNFNFVTASVPRICTQMEISSRIEDVEAPSTGVINVDLLPDDVVSVSDSWRSSQSSIVEYLCCVEPPASPSIEGEDDSEKLSNFVDLIDSADERMHESDTKNYSREVLLDEILSKNDSSNFPDPLAAVKMNRAVSEDLATNTKDSRGDADSLECLRPNIQVNHALVNKYILEDKTGPNIQVNHALDNKYILEDKTDLIPAVVHVSSNAQVDPTPAMINHKILYQDDDAPNSLNCSLADFEENDSSQDDLTRDATNRNSPDDLVSATTNPSVVVQEDRASNSMNSNLVDYEQNSSSETAFARDRMNRSLFDYVVDHSFQDDVMNVSVGITEVLTPDKLNCSPENRSNQTHNNKDRNLFGFAMNLSSRDGTLSHRINDTVTNRDRLFADVTNSGDEDQNKQATVVIKPSLDRQIDPTKNSIITSHDAHASEGDIMNHSVFEKNDNSQDEELVREMNRSLFDYAISNSGAQDEAAPDSINHSQGDQEVLAHDKLNHNRVENKANKVFEIVNGSCNPFDSEMNCASSLLGFDTQCQEDRVDLAQNMTIHSRVDQRNESLEIVKLGVLENTDSAYMERTDKNKCDLVPDNICSEHNKHDIINSFRKDQEVLKSHAFNGSLVDNDLAVICQEVEVKLASAVSINSLNEDVKQTLVNAMSDPTEPVKLEPGSTVNSSTDEVHLMPDEVHSDHMESESDMNLSKSEAPLEMMNCSHDDTNVPVCFGLGQDDEELFILTSVWREGDTSVEQSLSPATSQESVMDFDACDKNLDGVNNELNNNLLSCDYFKKSVASVALPAKINESDNINDKLISAGNGLLACVGSSKEMTTGSAFKEQIHSTMTIDVPVIATKLSPSLTTELKPNNSFQIQSVKQPVGSTASGSTSGLSSLACSVSTCSLGRSADPRPHVRSFKAPHAKPNAFSAKVSKSSFTVADTLSSAKQALKLVISANATSCEYANRNSNSVGASSCNVFTLASLKAVAIGSRTGKASIPSSRTAANKTFSSGKVQTSSANKISSSSCKISTLEPVVTTPTAKVTTSSSSGTSSVLKLSTSTTNSASSSVKGPTFKTSPSAAVKITTSSTGSISSCFKVLSSVTSPSVILPTSVGKVLTSKSTMSSTMCNMSSATKVSVSATNGTVSLAKVPTSSTSSLSSAVKVSVSATNGTVLRTNGTVSLAKVPTSTSSLSSAIKVSVSATNGTVSLAKVPTSSRSSLSSAVKVSTVTTKILPSAVKLSLSTSNTSSPGVVLKSANAIKPSAIKVTTPATSSLSTAKVSTSADGALPQDKVEACKVRRSSQVLNSPRMEYIEPVSFTDLMLCRNRCTRGQASQKNRLLLVNPDTNEKGRFVGYNFKRSTKEDVDRMFGKLLGGRLSDSGHEDVPFDASDVPDFAEKKALTKKLDTLLK